MAASDSEELELTKDPKWSDIVPIPQDDGPKPVVAIRYSAEFREVMDYFRAILAANEVSDRALELTNRVIRVNAANYTAWQYRRELLFSLKKDLYAELAFITKVATKGPKNYQLWWHRRVIIGKIAESEKAQNTDGATKFDPDSEKPLIKKILDMDAKNYHAWSHLHWLLRTFGNWDGELEFVDELLRADVRNNSAWNHRHFVIVSTTGFTYDVVVKEIQYCQQKIGRLSDNDSVWFYYTDLVLTQLRGLTLSTVDKAAEAEDKSQQQSWKALRSAQIEWLTKLIEAQPYASRSILFFIDLLCDDKLATAEDIGNATEMCDKLAMEIDRIRCHYYQYLKETQIKMCPIVKE